MPSFRLVAQKKVCQNKCNCVKTSALTVLLCNTAHVALNTRSKALFVKYSKSQKLGLKMYTMSDVPLPILLCYTSTWL